VTRWLVVGSLVLVGTEAAALRVVYPPPDHQTIASHIFLIGTHPPNEAVWVNGQVVARSPAGHFAPRVPLSWGNNTIHVQAGAQTVTLNVRRLPPPEPATPLLPAVEVARLPGEPLCFQAFLPTTEKVSLALGTWQVDLWPRWLPDLAGNEAVLVDPLPALPPRQRYVGCLRLETPGFWGQPELRWGEQRWQSPGSVTILDPNQLAVATLVTEGIARTGPGTAYSRLTPLPAGTQDQVIAQEGDWLQLRYGGWVQRQQVTLQHTALLPSLLRGVRGHSTTDWTEIHFPLTRPVPITIHQEPGVVHLTLWHTIAQTDIIRLGASAALHRFTWQQTTPETVRYSFYLPTEQAWGYRVHYQDHVLVLALRHPPPLRPHSLAGVTILLDPGHGGPEDVGAVGPDGTPEKDVNLTMAHLVAAHLRQRGARVLLTRTGDEDVSLATRVAQIQTQQPHLALSIHYNALPDGGDVWGTQGIGTFWYHPQSQPLAIFLHNYLTRTARRPSYGVFWHNLALTRPTVCPAVLLELGFMIHPQEFEWIVNPQAQQHLAQTLAAGIEAWLRQTLAPLSPRV
jgi:N-acetylmuramoyl-L-alanine amidase